MPVDGGPPAHARSERPLDVTASPSAAPTTDPAERLRRELHDLYGARHREPTDDIVSQVERFAASRPSSPPNAIRTWTERDALLITYGDQVRRSGEAPLRTLHRFLQRRLSGLLTAVHLLPVYPSSSDGGFAVTDYSSIDPALGGWPDVESIARDFDVMLDVVLNHASASHPWLAGFLAGDPAYAEHFIEAPPGADLSAVVRPRARPLITRFPSPTGARALWTTFSPDQVDLNYRNPRVLERMVDVVLGYLGHGASLFRLDAVGYSWKKPGTSSLNLAGAHRLVRIFRAVLDAAAAPSAALVTETNVPQHENAAYFGDGTDEAQAVYQFCLPPLVLHALLTGDAGSLASWISQVEAPPAGCVFLNFLASHDGIGLLPAEGLLPPAEIDALVAAVTGHGGLVSMRDTPRGPRPYELNTTLFDGLSDPNAREPAALPVSRFLAANSVMLALAGVPAIYVHSLFGSPNDLAGVERTGSNRQINRRRFREAELESELADPRSRAARVFRGYARLLRARASHPAFRPDAPQRILEAPRGILAFERGSSRTGRVRCLVNLTAAPRRVRVPGPTRDLLSRRTVAGRETLELAPYQTLWLAAARPRA
jgi:glucosylglycerate phosphorylase